jgi:hypothetical protein
LGIESAMQKVASTRGADRASSERRSIFLAEGGQVPVLPGEPLLSSASQRWEGFLLERHLTDREAEVPEHRHAAIALSLQLNAAYRFSGSRPQGGKVRLHVQAASFCMVARALPNRLGTVDTIAWGSSLILPIRWSFDPHNRDRIDVLGVSAIAL